MRKLTKKENKSIAIEKSRSSFINTISTAQYFNKIYFKNKQERFLKNYSVLLKWDFK